MKPKRRDRGRLWVLVLLLMAAGVAAATYFLTRTPTPAPLLVKAPVRVVGDRPGGARVGEGATISEPEAMRRLQRSFNLAPDCVAIMSHGYRAGAYDLTAINRCDKTRLGRWRVDGKSGSVSRRRG